LLTSGQIAHFETFGYVMLPKLFTYAEMDIITFEANEIFQEMLGVQPSTTTKYGKVEPFFERRPFLNSLLDDDRTYLLAEQLLGSDFLLDQTEGNIHQGDTGWHGSGKWKILPWIKIVLYLEPLTRDTGALRVIPGSHIIGDPDLYAPLRADNSEDKPVFDMPQSEIPSVALEIEPGDVIVFTEDILHASFGGRSGRQQHAMNFLKNPTSKVEIERLIDRAKRIPPTGRPLVKHLESDRPRLRRMVARLVELGLEPLELELPKYPKVRPIH